jgi:cysteine desulfurase/selenocysteine lyase
MFNFLNKKSSQKSTSTSSQAVNLSDFNYLDSQAFYFDTACQTLRPRQVIEAENRYYHQFNSCGHRVKYPWGEKTDRIVEDCRLALLDLVGKNPTDYTVAFTQNTTSGINTILHQLDPQQWEKIVTSEIEHNSVFLSSMTWAKRNRKERLVLPRQNQSGDQNGSLIYDPEQLERALVLLNTTSNIDGRQLTNLSQLAQNVRAGNGILMLDACQTLAHNPESLRPIDFDVCFGSGHKMYAPSIGFIIIKKSLVTQLDCYLIGGSTVQDVQLNDYQLVSDPDQIYARIEPGLQDWAAIVGLEESLRWRKKYRNHLGQTAGQQDTDLAQYLHQKLQTLDKITLLNPDPSPIVSLYSDKIDGHRLGTFLAEKGIMCRTGYHCCHYYLKHKLGLPPLFRISLGLNNNRQQIDHLVDTLRFILDNF